MPARENRYITNWLAAYCGDEQTLFPQAVQTIEKQLPVKDDNGWPLIDTVSENQRLVRAHFPGFFENLAPRNNTANRLTAISSKTVRAIVECVSSIQFCMRGYLVDLSTERTFAMRVIDFQRDFALPQGSDENRGDYPRAIVKGDEVTPVYAGIAYPKSRFFVGEINFSDFACFELNGFITNLDEDGWQDGFLKDLQNVVELISP
jgi:hypothetical protein